LGSLQKIRNQKTKIKRNSIDIYFMERCSGGPKSKDFWPTIKPFLSKHTQNKNANEIILKENDNLVSDQSQVSTILNDFYVNIANNIGINNNTPVNKDHPSISKISLHHTDNSIFDFKFTTCAEVKSHLNSLDPKKATGVDALPPKILKAASNIISQPITNIANHMIKNSQFPNNLKLAQVTPIYKKEDPFVKMNYRPVSILPSMSKIFEKIINNQLSTHFENIFSNYLAAFRPNYGCQTTLLRLCEDWKQSLDKNEYIAAILMDLSKAFDCLPHDLIIAKLSAYGLSDSACTLIHSYLSERKQRVKLGSNHSPWLETKKGVPQGSILGPLIFNIFMNDIFYFVHKSTLYNYADDNTLSFNHKNIETLKSVLESESTQLIQWFNFNQMQANPDKFQAISIGKKTHEHLKEFSIGDNTIKCEDVVKLLGIDIDFLINFDQQISNMCKKAAKQLNVLLRLSKFLTSDNKILIYKLFIRSNFNFCPLVWHFCSKTNSDKLEKLQHRALRITFNDFSSSYETLLDRANMPTLHLSRLRTMAIEAYKIIFKLSPPYLHNLMKIKHSSYSFRYSNTAEVPHIRTESYGRKSFSFEAAQVWNSLPNTIRCAENYKEFVRLIRTWCGPSCKCSLCS